MPYMAVISPTDHWQIIETSVTLGKIAASSEYLDAFLYRIDKMKEVIPTFKTWCEVIGYRRSALSSTKKHRNHVETVNGTLHGSTHHTVEVLSFSHPVQHFPKSNPLYKIFDRNTLKLSHSCMNNVKTISSYLDKADMNKSSKSPERCLSKFRG